MKIETHKFKLPEGTFEVEATRFEAGARRRFAELYLNWRSMSDELRSLGGRGVNLPEVLSEGSFALEMDVLSYQTLLPLDPPLNGMRYIS